MAGQIKANQLQLGDSATATQNFVWQTNVDGTAKLARGNVGATTQDILIVSATGLVTLLAPPIVPAQSMVRLNTANGYGSTNTMIRRFTNVVTNQGTDITYADSATLGASFTINTNGVYSISYDDDFNGASGLGLSLNTTVPTTAVTSIPLGEQLCISSTSAVNVIANVSITSYLPVGSVVRAHCIATPSGVTPAHFTITRVA